MYDADDRYVEEEDEVDFNDVALYYLGRCPMDRIDNVLSYINNNPECHDLNLATLDVDISKLPDPPESLTQAILDRFCRGDETTDEGDSL